jgi:hypothetical protein
MVTPSSLQHVVCQPQLAVFGRPAFQSHLRCAFSYRAYIRKRKVSPNERRTGRERRLKHGRHQNVDIEDENPRRTSDQVVKQSRCAAFCKAMSEKLRYPACDMDRKSNRHVIRVACQCRRREKRCPHDRGISKLSITDRLRRCGTSLD